MLTARARHAFFEGPYPLIFGHRGAAGRAPENTLASFGHALEDGADIIESDLRLTRDGHVVMIHDETVDRIANGHGRIADMTLAELEMLDAGYHFSNDDGEFPFRGRGIRIPTLRDAFDRFPGVRFNLDLKDRNPALIEEAVSVVAHAGRADTTLLTTFNYGTQRRLYRAMDKAGIKTATAAADFEVTAAVLGAKIGLKPPGPLCFEVPRAQYGVPIVTPAFIEYAHRYGLPVFVWTVNDPDEMRLLFNQRVDGIMTDFPARAHEIRGTLAYE